MPCNMAATDLGIVATLILLVITSVHGERVWFKDMGNHAIEKDYEAHNIFIVNGTTVSLESWAITAPESNDDGEDAVRVEDATFHAKSGTIAGGHGVGGTGVTISTTRDSDHPPGTATFEAGVEVTGGAATRVETTQGGDAVQVIQRGSTATFNGGKFVPGTGCTMKVCGKVTDDGRALQVVQGTAIVKGGTFEGVLYNMAGTIELHGCVDYDEDTQKITGVLLDKSNIDVMYEQPKGQNSPPTIVKACPEKAPAESSSISSGGWKTMTPTDAVISASFVLGIIINLQ